MTVPGFKDDPQSDHCPLATPWQQVVRESSLNLKYKRKVLRITPAICGAVNVSKSEGAIDWLLYRLPPSLVWVVPKGTRYGDQCHTQYHLLVLPGLGMDQIPIPTMSTHIPSCVNNRPGIHCILSHMLD
jgi:hypothetical protein